MPEAYLYKVDRSSMRTAVLDARTHKEHFKAVKCKYRALFFTALFLYSTPGCEKGPQRIQGLPAHIHVSRTGLRPGIL